MKDVSFWRKQFPALHRDFGGRAAVFLDGPGGSQVPQRVIDAVSGYFTRHNSNCGGVFATCLESDQLLDRAHTAVARFLNAPSPDEIVFGANMTTLTLALGRAMAKTWKPGDEVVVTRLDHDANVSPWVLAAESAGATVRKVDIRVEDCTLDIDDFTRQLSSRTRLVAFAGASNLVGSVNDVARLSKLAHERGALVFVDAVAAAPHLPLDVQAWDCDFLACSAYKFFGPHVGILWGRRTLLESLPVFKLRVASEELPGRWMTGTQNHEGIAGTLAAIEYIDEIGGMTTIRDYERELCAHLLGGIAAQPRYKVWGITEESRLAERVPTIAVTAQDRTPRELAMALAEQGVFAWNGNMYALELTERLGLEATGGVLRLGLMHYNTHDEVDRVLRALAEA